MIARFAGDEFVIFIPDLFTISDLNPTGDKIIELIEDKFSISYKLYQLGTSIVIYSDHGSDLDILLANADMAMHSAKVSGERSYVVCDY